MKFKMRIITCAFAYLITSINSSSFANLPVEKQSATATTSSSCTTQAPATDDSVSLSNTDIAAFVGALAASAVGIYFMITKVDWDKHCR